MSAADLFALLHTNCTKGALGPACLRLRIYRAARWRAAAHGSFILQVV